jgi:hypothetical protein
VFIACRDGQRYTWRSDVPHNNERIINVILSWLRCYVANRKIAGSSPDKVTEFFYLRFNSSFQPHYGLGSIQLPTEMSIRNLPGG